MTAVFRDSRAQTDSSSDRQAFTKRGGPSAAAAELSDALRMLILDDDEAIADILMRVARRLGWQTEHAQSGAEFRNQIVARWPDAIMLDLNLRGEDGVEELRFLHACGYDGPIVLMSGFDDRVLDAAWALGVSLGLHIGARLRKPATTDEVGAVIGAINPKPARDAGTQGDPATAGAAEWISAERVDRGLAAGELELEFQPIVDMRSGCVGVFEALLRWNHPRLGRVMPGSSPRPRATPP